MVLARMGCIRNSYMSREKALVLQAVLCRRGRVVDASTDMADEDDTRACHVMHPRAAPAVFLYTAQKAAACRGCCRS
jgi:hypothetical protein